MTTTTQQPRTTRAPRVVRRLPDQHVDVTFPVLLDYLRRVCCWTPNHIRPLDGRVVDTWFDPTTGQNREVTDYELAARIVFGVADPERGRDVQQVWYAEDVEGIRMRHNAFFEGWTSHYGLQYGSRCGHCGTLRWNNADRSPTPLCPDCRAERSVRCPEFHVACATAYRSKRYQCRCAACRAWNTAAVRRRRHRCTRSVSPVVKDVLEGQSPVVDYRTNSASTRPDPTARTPVDSATPHDDAHDPATWSWLPVAARAAVSAYVADLHTMLAPLCQE